MKKTYRRKNKQTLKKHLDLINDFTVNSFKANFHYRFRNEPYMLSSWKKGKRESIAGHMWGAAVMWMIIKNSCPNLASKVNSEKILEIILFHDAGELISGDIPIYTQYLSKNSSSKKKKERRDLQKVLKGFPVLARKRLLKYFDDFENHTKTSDLEILVARFIDSLHGGLYVYTHGNSLKKMQKIREAVTKRHFGGVVKRLFQVLDEKGEKKAKKEVEDLLEGHMKLWENRGIKIERDSYFS